MRILNFISLNEYKPFCLYLKKIDHIFIQHGGFLLSSYINQASTEILKVSNSAMEPAATNNRSITLPVSWSVVFLFRRIQRGLLNLINFLVFQAIYQTFNGYLHETCSLKYKYINFFNFIKRREIEFVNLQSYQFLKLINSNK